MARTIPPTRFAQLVEAATKAFIARGYRQTQMADVAEALGVAKGTLYGYVESKDALFDAAVRYADRHDAIPEAAALPLSTPAPGATVAYVRERLAAEAGDMTLHRVVTGTLVIDEASQELRLILADLFLRLARNRYALKLVDRCAGDYPALAAVWFGEGRWAQHALLVQLIRCRIADGRFHAFDSVEVVARTVLETVAFWALHRHFDPSPRPVDDAGAERAVIDFVSRGLLAGRI